MIIADTGFWLALSNKSDSWHKKAKDALSAIEEPLITTWPVVTETCHLLLHRIGYKAQLSFIRSLADQAFQIHEIDSTSYPRLVSLMEKYKDLPMDIADASLVLLAEHLTHGRILSTDERDFKTYKWKSHKPFENLLLKQVK